jgi:hypothetical protein
LHSQYPQQLYVVCIHPSLTLLAVITSHVLLPRRTVQNLRYRLSFPLGLLTHEDGTDTLSWNVGKQLPQDAAYYPRRPQISRIECLIICVYV